MLKRISFIEKVITGFLGSYASVKSPENTFFVYANMNN